MKPQLWPYIIVIVFGATFAGFWGGHMKGVRETHVEASKFLRDFVHSTHFDTYLQEHGQQQWAAKIAIFGTSYVRAQHNGAVALGMCCLAAGLIGLLLISKRNPTTPGKTGDAD